MAIIGVAAGVAASFMGACSNQPEGSRCDKLSGDSRATSHPGSDDCESPLVCTSAEELLWPAVGEAGAQRPSTNICCPPDRTTATTDVCRQKTTPLPVPDAATDTGSPTDAQADVQNDTGTPDSGPDAADAADQ
jgi:hypothetical protein